MEKLDETLKDEKKTAPDGRFCHQSSPGLPSRPSKKLVGDQTPAGMS